MRYEDRPLNGHHHPSLDLVGILLDIKHSIGGLTVGQEMTREQMTDRFDRQDERIDTLHERIDTHLAAPNPEPRGWASSTGLTPKELAGLILLAAAGLFGTLTPDHITAWLGH